MTYSNVIEQIVASYNLSEKEKRELIASEEKINKIIKKQLPPDEEFNLLAFGAYKECYNLSANFVIKFCSVNNNTSAEIGTYQKAWEENLSDLFLDTWFFPLDTYLPTTYIEEPEFDYLEIQPKVKTFAIDIPHYKSFPYTIENYLAAPIQDPKSDEIADFHAIRGYLSDLSWGQAIVDVFGMKYFNHFIEFCDKVELGDLHGQNIGYYQNIPVILDCLSEGS
jgi:hypothetical protein